MERKILNYEKTFHKAQRTIQRAEQALERSVILERDLASSKQREKDYQREILIRKKRERDLGFTLLLSNICWILLLITLIYTF